MLKYRHPTIEDLPKLNEWISVDPDHRNKCTGDFFLLKPEDKGMQCIAVEDDIGTIFFLKFTNVLSVDVQFPPEENSDKERIREALKEALAYFSVSSRNLGYHGMIFESVSRSLIQFFQKLGFKRLIDFFKVDL